MNTDNRRDVLMDELIIAEACERVFVRHRMHARAEDARADVVLLKIAIADLDKRAARTAA